MSVARRKPLARKKDGVMGSKYCPTIAGSESFAGRSSQTVSTWMRRLAAAAASTSVEWYISEYSAGRGPVGIIRPDFRSAALFLRLPSCAGSVPLAEDAWAAAVDAWGVEVDAPLLLAASASRSATSSIDLSSFSFGFLTPPLDFLGLFNDLSSLSFLSIVSH